MTGSSTTSAALGVPSGWVRRFAHLIPRGGTVLDVAAGGGRHTRFFHQRGNMVTAVDRRLDILLDLDSVPGIVLVKADLEADPWPFAAQRFDAVVVTNYLYRPILSRIVDAVKPNGVLIYETFASGNEQFGRPSDPAYLLQPGELLSTVAGRLTVVGYEHGIVHTPRPSAIQHIAAVSGGPLLPL